MAQQIIRFNQESLNLDTAWEDVTNKPEEFPPEAHQHEWGDILNEPDFAPTSHNHEWGDITSVPAFINWTPSFLYSGTAQFNQTRRQGRSKILNDICFFHFTLQGSISGGSIGGFLRIGGLPNAAINLTGYTTFIPLSICLGLNAVYKQANLSANNSELFITNASSTPIGWDTYTPGTALDIRGNGWYQIS